MHRADSFIGISLKREEIEAIIALAKSRGLTKAQMGRALLRAGKGVFEEDPEKVLPLARI